MPPDRSKFQTTLNPYTAKSLVTYAEALLEAFAVAKVIDHIEAITETDCYPRLTKIPNVEWMIGWLHGVAEAHDVTAKLLWAEALRMIAAKAQKRAAPKSGGRKAA